MFHGGKSTGPATLNGKSRCAEAKTIHGRETRVIRTVRAKKLAELKFLLKNIGLKFTCVSETWVLKSDVSSK